MSPETAYIMLVVCSLISVICWLITVIRIFMEGEIIWGLAGIFCCSGLVALFWAGAKDPEPGRKIFTIWIIAIVLAVIVGMMHPELVRDLR